MLNQMFGWIEDIWNMLENNPDSFFSRLLLLCMESFLGLCAIFLRKMYKRFSEGKEKIFELYCKRESDNFYVRIMFLEITIVIAMYFVVVFCFAIIEGIFDSLDYELIRDERFERIIVAAISTGILLLISKMNWMRKRILGDEEGELLILSSIFIFHIGIAGGVLGGAAKFWLVLYLACEVWSILHFQGRYVKYGFSSLKMYLCDGSFIICKDIEKVYMRKKYVIVENEDRNIVLQYDKIYKVEYYGLPKIVLNEDVEKWIIRKFKRLWETLNRK